MIGHLGHHLLAALARLGAAREGTVARRDGIPGADRKWRADEGAPACIG